MRRGVCVCGGGDRGGGNVCMETIFVAVIDFSCADVRHKQPWEKSLCMFDTGTA